MKSKGMFLSILFFFACWQYSPAQVSSTRDYFSQEIVFKKIDTVELKLKLFYPSNYKKNKKYPTIVFFFGGGWKRGDMRQFEPQAKYLASKGMIAVTADYRVAERYQTTPFEAVADAKSAIRYLRATSKKLGINEDQIVAAGGSAGGHLAAAADLTNLDETHEDLQISSRPDAVILYNPVINNGPGGYGYKLFKESYTKISPFHNIRKHAAPTLIMSGTQDRVVPVKILESYKEKMLAEGNRCDIRLYDGGVHGFYKYNPKKDQRFYQSTLQDVEVFLRSLKFIK